MKRYSARKRGTMHAALTRAMEELGGADKVGDVIERPPGWVYDAANPHRVDGKKAALSWAQARAVARAGGFSIAEDMAAEAGGVFMPPIPATSPSVLHGALAAYLNEHGQAVSEIIRRAADGEFDRPDADAALPELDDALRALMTVRALLERIAKTGETLR